LLGTLISSAADAARTADAARQHQIAEAVAVDVAAGQAVSDADAYRAQLQDARTRLAQAYADLAARDAAYRELLGVSQSNVDRLQAANQTLQRQLADTAARVQRAEAQIQALQTAATSRHRDDD
jgi:chromosome segregation ATPase